MIPSIFRIVIFAIRTLLGTLGVKGLNDFPSAEYYLFRPGVQAEPAEQAGPGPHPRGAAVPGHDLPGVLRRVGETRRRPQPRRVRLQRGLRRRPGRGHRDRPAPRREPAGAGAGLRREAHSARQHHWGPGETGAPMGLMLNYIKLLMFEWG